MMMNQLTKTSAHSDLSKKFEHYSFFISLFISLSIHFIFIAFLSKELNFFLFKQFDEKKVGDAKPKTQLSLIIENEKIAKKAMQSSDLLSSSDDSSKVDDLTYSKENLGENSAIAKYLTQIRSLIVDHKFKNKLATKLHLIGSVELSFTIIKPNQIKAIKILKSSGHQPLDDSAVQTLTLISVFPPIPEELKVASLDVSFVLEYQ